MKYSFNWQLEFHYISLCNPGLSAISREGIVIKRMQNKKKHLMSY